MQGFFYHHLFAGPLSAAEEVPVPVEAGIEAPAVSGICVSEEPLVNAVFLYDHLFAGPLSAAEEVQVEAGIEAPAVSGICVSEEPLVNEVLLYHHLFAGQPAAEEVPVETADAPAVPGICVSEEPLVNACFFLSPFVCRPITCSRRSTSTSGSRD